jgi:Flp pilus assembly protein TadG
MTDVERGSAALEMVLITPVLLVLLLFAVAAGRFSLARNQVSEAARDAAREASTWRTPAEATSHGTERGLDSLGAGHVTCRSPSVAIDTTGLHPGGAAVADVTCTVQLGDLVGLRMGGSRTLRARAVAVVDTFQSNG